MKAITGSQFKKILEKNGWELKRVQGSHHVYAKEGNLARISIHVHRNTPLKIGLLKHLMEIASLEERDL